MRYYIEYKQNELLRLIWSTSDDKIVPDKKGVHIFEISRKEYDLLSSVSGDLDLAESIVNACKLLIYKKVKE